MDQKRFSGKVGEEYELFKMVCPHYDELQEAIGYAIASRFKDSDNSEIKALEIGCGSGYTTSIVLDSDKRVNVTAIDNEPIMIDQARDVLKNYVSENKVSFREVDALSYLKSCSEDSYDIFFSAFSLHNFSQEYRSDLIREIYRVLKKGGLFVNGDKYAKDNLSDHEEDLKWQVAQFDLYDKIGKPELKKEWTQHYLEDEHPDILMREGEAIDEMGQIGFRDIKNIFRDHMESIIMATK